MKKIISTAVILLISIIISAQNYDGVMLMFNNIQPQGTSYRLQDILDTDTLKTNFPNLTIASYSCSSQCSIDWEVKHSSNILSSTAKHYIKTCASRPNSKVYFDNVRAINSEGKLISLGTIAIRVR